MRNAQQESLLSRLAPGIGGITLRPAPLFSGIQRSAQAVFLYLSQISHLYAVKVDEWDGGDLLLEPKYPWELVQIGNYGAPIELDEGWLVLTHGVGAMRKYAIGAALLDKDDPSRVIGRTPNPILSAADEDREGYVPNVVYTRSDRA